MPIVAMPDGTQVQFPDDMPADRIRGLITQKFPDAVGNVPVGQSRAADDPLSATPKMGGGEVALEGYLSGVSGNLRDEIYGLSEASGLPNELGGFRAPVGGARLLWEYLSKNPGEAQRIYEQARDEKRSIQKQAREERPGTYLAGQVGGAVALPGGAMMQAATLPARMVRSGAVGAGYGGIAGFGEGEGLSESAKGAATGAAVGAGVGAVAPPLVEGLVQGARSTVGPLIRGVRGALNPESEAARRVVTAIDRDVRASPTGTPGITPQELTASAQQGGPAALMDLGGETTRGLARSAANTSPEGRATLNQAINQRFEGQAGRVTDWLRHTFHFPNATAQQEALEQTARSVNRGAYARAYRDGDRGVWSPELERLTSSPDVVAAMREAATKGKSRAVTEGFGGFNPGVTFDNGIVNFQRGRTGQPTYPNLQFWDYTKRALDDAERAARRAGRTEEASVLGQLSRSLRAELDTQVPSYGQARAGAASFFGAENALEAGQNFVRTNLGIRETRAALARMSPTERQLFQDGFVSRFIETLEATGDRRSVLNKIASSPAAREKLTLALGPQRAAELEAGLRVEGIMDLARGAVQGNSTTARQLAELGFAGGAYGLGAMNFGAMDPHTLGITALAGALAAGRRGIDQRVSRQVAEMLSSNDPSVLRRGIQAIARSEGLINALRSADRRLASVGGQQIRLPGSQAGSIGRTDDDEPAVPRPPSQY